MGHAANSTNTGWKKVSLSCECGDDYDFYYDDPQDYTTLQTSKRKRCISCKDLINIGATCLTFGCWRRTTSDIEDRIYGSEKYLADQHMCEECGDLYFSLKDLGFCIEFNEGETMKDLVSEYNEHYV